MIDPGDVLIICPSVHDVMAAEKALKEGGIWCDLLPVPREISADCGLVVVVHEKELAQASALLDQVSPAWRTTPYPRA